MNINTSPVTYSSIVEIGELAAKLEKETVIQFKKVGCSSNKNYTIECGYSGEFEGAHVSSDGDCDGSGSAVATNSLVPSHMGYLDKIKNFIFLLAA